MHIYLPSKVVTQIDKNFGWYQTTFEAEGRRYSRTVDSALRERTYYLCWYIITTWLYDVRDEEGSLKPAKRSIRQFVNIPRGKMKQHGGSKYYLDIINFLKEHGIIEVDNKYSTGEDGNPGYTKSFRFINIDPESFTLTKLELTTKPLLKVIMKQDQPAEDAPLFLIKYMEVLGQISISEESEKYLVKRAEDQYTDFLLLEFYRAYLPIFSFRNGGSFTKDKQGRIHFPLNRLNNNLRRYLCINGNVLPPDWVEVDISACAPFLFSCYLIKKGHVEPDVWKFHELASEENFYECLGEYCIKHLEYCAYQRHKEEAEETMHTLSKTIADEDWKGGGAKEWIKKVVLRVLNSKPSQISGAKKKYRPLIKALKISFPTVFNQVEELNRDKSTFYHTITPLETSVMVDFLVPRLLERGIIAITRHDGVLCTSADADRVKDIMEEGFEERIGAVPFIKVKSVKRGN